MSTTQPSAIPLALRGEPITYRQLDFWTRSFPDLFSPDARPRGTGRRREFTALDIRRLRTMARLVAAGVRPVVASLVAGEDQTEVRVSEHVTITVSAA